MSIRRSLRAASLAGLVLGSLAAPAHAQGPEWTLREELRLGEGRARGDTLPRIARVTVGRDGSVYALSPDGALIILDPAGRLVRRVNLLDSAAIADGAQEVLERAGRELRSRSQSESLPMPPRPTVVTQPGAPGDLAMGWVGDTLWIAGLHAGRIALLDRRGDSVGTVAYGSTVAGEAADAPLALLADRSLLRTIVRREVRERLPNREPPGNYSMPVIPPRPMMPAMPVIPGLPVPGDESPDGAFLMRVTPGGEVVQGLEIFAVGPQGTVLRNDGGESIVVRTGLQDVPLVATTPDGTRVVVVTRYRPTGAGPDSYDVATFDLPRGTRAARRHAYTPARASGAADSLARRIIDGPENAIQSRFLERFGSREEAREALRAALERGGYREPISEVVAGADHSIWLREQATGRWIVLGRDRGVAARVTLPAGARLLHADDETIWVSHDPASRSAAGTRLVRYRLVKP